MYKGLVFTDKIGRKCIHGTDPTHPYVVQFLNGAGVVGVKSPEENGGEDTDRIRVITWDVLTGATAGDDYDALINLGWESKPEDHHVSVRAIAGTCPTCGASTKGKDTSYRVAQAISFLQSI